MWAFLPVRQRGVAHKVMALPAQRPAAAAVVLMLLSMCTAPCLAQDGTCDKGRIVGGPSDGVECSCGASCDLCTVVNGTPEKCLRCDDTRFLAGGACVKNIECLNSRVFRKGVRVEGTCKCERATGPCRRCSLSKAGTDIEQACTSCKGGTFFLEGQCLSQCPEGLAETNTHSQSNRKCKCSVGAL